MTSWYALWARRYMHEFNVTNADLAEVAVFTRYHATLNPDSVMGSRGEITVEDVLNSRYVWRAPPPAGLLDRQRRRLRRRDRVGRTRPRLPQAARLDPGRRRGLLSTDFYATINDPWFPNQGKAVRKATDRAFGLAGISRDDIDVAGLYDCFTAWSPRSATWRRWASASWGRGPTT